MHGLAVVGERVVDNLPVDQVVEVDAHAAGDVGEGVTGDEKIVFHVGDIQPVAVVRVIEAVIFEGVVADGDIGAAGTDLPAAAV